MSRTPHPFRRWSAVLALALSLPLAGLSAAPASGAPVARSGALAGVLPASPTALPTATPAASGLRVATFNVRCANCSRNSRINKREKKWETRRAKVVAQIKAEKVDVIGLQEASPGLLKGKKISQFEDLANRLGAPYALTNTHRYGCAKSTSYKNCKKVDNGAAADVRIIYNTNRLTLLEQGSKQLDKEKATSGPRFVAWAIFADKKDGRTFMFATAHTEPGQSKAKRALRKKQAKMILAELEANNPTRLPVVITGDFSSSKLTAVNPVYDVLTGSGMVIDPLGNTKKQKSAKKAIAKKLINVKYDTLNKFKAKPVSRKGYALGAHLDYIFTAKQIKVQEYKVVMSLKKGKFSGVIPSDHNMVRATIQLP